MAKKSGYSLTKWIIQIALGLLLAIGGIWGLQGGGDFGVAALRDIFDGNAEKIIVVVFSVIELLAGLYLILELFLHDLGKFDNILMLIILIVWIVAIVLGDFLNKGFLEPTFIEWLWRLAGHLVILGAIFYCKD